VQLWGTPDLRERLRPTLKWSSRGADDGGVTSLRALAGRFCRRRSCGDRGAALVEFAFILPILAMLVFGMLTGGIVMNRKASLTHATREAARYGATVPIDQLGTTDAWADHVRDVAVERSGGELTSGQICVALMDGTTVEASTGGSACIDGDINTGHRVQVTATLSDQEINAILLRVPVTVESEATAKYEE
jgi:Flp pilus assembly protein TadG